MSNFSALYTGLSGLMAHRRATEIASHNIANVNTTGYSRQRAELRADGGSIVSAFHSRTSTVGNGVHVESITRIRDEFLETQHRNERAIGASLSATSDVLARLESAFPEPSDNGIAAQLGEFWKTWQTVANAPGSEPARTAVLEKGRVAAEGLNLADRQLRTQYADTVGNIEITVDKVNRLAEQVSRYDGAIRAAIASGQQPNDLLDERDQLALEITELTGATVATKDDGSMEIFVAGRALVYGPSVQKLTVDKPPAGSRPGDADVVVRWENDNQPATLTAGSIAGFVAGANEAIPHYLDEIDKVAQALATEVNALHRQGKGLDDPAGVAANRDFFFEDPTGVTAANIGLNPGLKARDLAIGDPAGGPLDATFAEAIAGVGQSAGGPDAAYNSMVVALGSEVSYFFTQTDVQSSVVTRLDENRRSVSGVNLDEEMVSLVAAQHAYAAAARVITTADEMLDTLINRMGLVGR